MKHFLSILLLIFSVAPCAATYKIVYKLTPQKREPLICSSCRSLYETKSSYPYITGCTFRAACDFIVDSEVNTANPKDVGTGDLIFVAHDCIDAFFKQCRPAIKNPFIVVTHHCYGDGDASTPGRHVTYLDDELLIAWFTVNPDIVHPKLKPLPLGIANSFYPTGDTAVYEQHIKKCRRAPKTKLLYSNFYIGNCQQEREHVYRTFVDKPFCTTAPRKSQEEYLTEMAEHKFVLSPRGNGLDCYRTWEALFMGSIPIVRSSTLDPIFEDLPVLIVKNWDEITEEFLEQKYEEMQGRINTFNFEKLYVPYWINEMLKCKFRAKLQGVK